MSFKVLIDSSADLPLDKASAAGIEIIPMPVTIGETTYLEGVNLSIEEFYADFANFPELPKTSQPNPKMLLEYYERALAEGHEVVAIHLSSGLSSTVSTAQMIAESTSAPERVHVIDSLGASLGYGLQALSARQILTETTSWPEAEKKILEVRNKMRYVFTIDTLEYLVKGGRVSKTAGFIGGLLDVKPVLHMTPDGRIEPFAKVRSRRAALRKLVEVMEQEIEHPEQQVIGISHANCYEDALSLEQEVRKHLQVKDILIGEIGCVIGSHAGPGTIAVYYQRQL